MHAAMRSPNEPEKNISTRFSPFTRTLVAQRVTQNRFSLCAGENALHGTKSGG